MELPNTREEYEIYDKVFYIAHKIQQAEGYANVNKIRAEYGKVDILPYVNWLYVNNHFTLWNNMPHNYQVIGNPEFVTEWDRREAKKTMLETSHKLQEEKDRKEWEMKIRAEQRDIDKVELQRSQRGWQRKGVIFTFLGLIAGIITGAGGMWLKYKSDYKSNNPIENSNNSNIINKAELPDYHVDTVVK